MAALCDSAVDLRSKVVLPGLIDAHIHMLQLGQYARMMKAGACGSIEELQTAVRSFAAAHPEEEWICGEGWAQDKLGRYPSRHDLDAAESSRPVLLLRVCSHIGVANTTALKLLGVTAEHVWSTESATVSDAQRSTHGRSDPEGGVILTAMKLESPPVFFVRKRFGCSKSMCRCSRRLRQTFFAALMSASSMASLRCSPMTRLRGHCTSPWRKLGSCHFVYS